MMVYMCWTPNLTKQVLNNYIFPPIILYMYLFIDIPLGSRKKIDKLIKTQTRLTRQAQAKILA